MPNTGNPSTDYLLVVITFLPLLPALLIFGRKLHLQEPLNFLLIICLFGFFKALLGLAYPLTKEDQSITDKIVELILLLLLVLCFRTSLNVRYRYTLDMLLSGLLSAVITYWSLKGWENTSPAIDVLLHVFLGGVIVVSLPAIIQISSLQVFRSSLFWIGGGTLFYILLYLLLEGIGFSYQAAPSPPDPDKRLFFLLADGVKYLFYLAAVVSARQQGEEKGVDV